MDRVQFERVLAEELDRLGGFTNFHGITPRNVRRNLFAPYQVLVELDRGEATKEWRDIWLIYEGGGPKYDGGYSIAYDGIDGQWTVIELVPGETYLEICELHARTRV